jgi:gliding motility-associated-like protein
MNIIKSFIFYFLLFATSLCMSQKEANIWYFGYGAGIDFNSGTPLPITDGMTISVEGCASIADKNGNLLFYTEGINVWNKNHQIMPNGTGLLGHESATQSSIIVPQPGCDSIYFIFTLDKEAGNNGLSYSEVNIKLNGGLGDITSNKNISLHSPTSEKVSATFHEDNENIWVVTHPYNSNNFYSYLVTKNGINTTPIISTSGSILNIGGLAFDAIGQMKISPNGKRIAMANMALNEIQIFDFNNNSGIVTHLSTISNYFWAYGIAFSRTSKYLYFNHLISGGTGVVTEIFQVDLTSSNISQSIINIGSISGFQQQSMQLAPDGHIYISMEDTTVLSIIDNPDAQGLGCNFNLKGFDLNGEYSGMGLPSFYQSLFNMPIIKFDTVCLQDSSSIECNDAYITQISWNFGDPGSGINNIGSGNSIKHLFSEQGIYNITMEGIKNGSPIYDTAQVIILPEPQINIQDSIYFCEPEIITLDAFLESATYLWSNQSTESSIDINTPGSYSITVTDSNDCSSSKNIALINDNCSNNDVYIPTSFSPNNDGNNDILYVRGVGVSTMRLQIYNRFGSLIFTSNNLSKGWDGKSENKPLNNAVFIYLLEVTFINGEQKTLKGNITLIN